MSSESYLSPSVERRIARMAGGKAPGLKPGSDVVSFELQAALMVETELGGLGGFTKGAAPDLSGLLKELRQLKSKWMRSLAEPSGSRPLSTTELPVHIETSISQDGAAEQAMEADGFLTLNGVAYMPLSEAVRKTGVQRDTLQNWIKNEIQFEGEPITAVFYKPTRNYFISQDSVDRISKRFIKWPSAEPARDVKLGKTEKGTGYLSLSEAARVAGMTDVTLRRWVREGSTTFHDDLDVVKDIASGHFYISQETVAKLAKHVQEFGVQRGRRAQPTLG